MTLSVLSLATTLPKPSSMATETANVPLTLTGILAPAPGCAVKASFGVPVVGTWRETPAAVFQLPLLTAPELVPYANTVPAPRVATTAKTMTKRVRLRCFIR